MMNYLVDHPQLFDLTPYLLLYVDDDTWLAESVIASNLLFLL